MKCGWANRLLLGYGRAHIVSAMALTLTLSGVTAAQSAQSYRQRAIELARNKSWDQAIASYHKALRSEEHTSELQSRLHLVCRLLLEKKKQLHDSTAHCA